MKAVSVSRVAILDIKEYGQKTLLDRAIPDYRDGLKPVQRRILWALWQSGARSSSSFKKKANMVGETMKYHPHGDAPISDAMTTMVHLRYPLLEGYGNWGDPILGDPAGAMRYIEVRLSKLGELFFEKLPITRMVKNYSGEYNEPLFLLPPLPFILLNGASGIAVGVSMNIPPHNLQEVVSYLMEVLKGKDPVKALKANIKGPDYNYGVLCSSEKELLDLYTKGEGTLRYRCDYEFKDGKLLIKSPCPGVSFMTLKSKLLKLQEQGVVGNVYEEGRSLVVEMQASAFEAIKPYLYGNIYYKFYVTERNSEEAIEFRPTSFIELSLMWLEFFKDSERKFLQYQIEQLEAKIHKKEVILKAVRNLDKIFSILKKSSNPKEDIADLLKVTEEDAKMLLDCKLSSFARTSVEALKKEIKLLTESKKELEGFLRDLTGFLIKRLSLLIKKFGDERGTKVREPEPEIVQKDFQIVIKKDGTYTTLKRTRGFKVTDPEFLVVTKEGRARLFRFPNLKHLKKYANRIVSVVSKSKYVALLDKDSKYLVCSWKDLPQNREFLLMNTKSEIRIAVGFDSSVKLNGKRIKADVVFKPGRAGKRLK